MRKSSMFYGVLLSMIMSVAAASEGVAQQKEIQSVAEMMAQKISVAGKSRIAVVDFTDLDGNVTQLGRYIAEQMSVALLNAAQGFEVMDRNHIKTLLQQHKLSSTGLVDPATATQLGKIAGVDALITGTITPFGDSVELAVKVLDVNTARLIGATTGNIPKTEAIKELLGKEISGETFPSTMATTTRTKSEQKVEMKGFVFELKSCSLSGQTVKCSLVITNTDNDRDLRLGYGYSPQSRLFDNDGSEYRLAGVQLANKSGRGDAASLLISGVTTNASLSFEGVSSQATMVTLFEIETKSGSDEFFVKFRNIPLSK